MASIFRARHNLRSARRTRFFSSGTYPDPSGSKPADAFWSIHNISLATTVTIVVYTLGSLYPPQIIAFISPRTGPAPPSDANSPAALAYTADLKSQLKSLPLLKMHRSRADADLWYETRPYLHFPEERHVNSLTARALRGPGKLAFAPLLRSKKDESETVAFIHVRRGLCGHDGIVHGGLLATLLDETLARMVWECRSLLSMSYF
jgi:hypothetical protein